MRQKYQIKTSKKMEVQAGFLLLLQDLIKLKLKWHFKHAPAPNSLKRLILGGRAWSNYASASDSTIRLWSVHSYHCTIQDAIMQVMQPYAYFLSS